MNDEIEFTVPFKVKRKRFRICEECEKRKFSTTLYNVYDNGLISYKEYYVCKKCMKEAKERARERWNSEDGE